MTVQAVGSEGVTGNGTNDGDDFQAYAESDGNGGTGASRNLKEEEIEPEPQLPPSEEGNQAFLDLQNQLDGLVHDARNDQVDPVQVLGQINAVAAEAGRQYNLHNIDGVEVDAINDLADHVGQDVALRADYDQINAGLNNLQQLVADPNHDGAVARNRAFGVNDFLDEANRLTPEQQENVRARVGNILFGEGGIFPDPSLQLNPDANMQQNVMPGGFLSSGSSFSSSDTG